MEPQPATPAELKPGQLVQCPCGHFGPLLEVVRAEGDAPLYRLLPVDDPGYRDYWEARGGHVCGPVRPVELPSGP